MTTSLPPWVDVVTAVLVVTAALLALTGSLGLVRLRGFFQRVHAPTLGSTGACWLLTLSTALQFSFVREQFYVHALLIALFITLTAPITTVFLSRAALFRMRLARQDVPPSVTEQPAPPPQA
ncbi:monovalent cation/H(+) antiporter subunit G [Pyxidicoccus xibeiensis]|uniref:monovalent cation/H(+) antiporter subunit G n=1 Tax=Pyxidicoccus xibeiensis TaxID=2906759 RepID=UPI0020A76283|nr:monovalent cation/H(+) antiporter subunit G [Pyxidicoccus xibeiensis]MCP3138820.1 monovalent cation/H(+) antiporter subunit G [Pyxidicoccus xibeiensis]